MRVVQDKMTCHCVEAFVCKSTAMQVVLKSPVNHNINSGIMFTIVLIKEINSLFVIGISRLMFCYHSMIYTASNLNNNFCWDSTSYRLNESEVSSSKSSLEMIALILVCRLLSADKISFTISHHRSVKNSLNFFFFR